MSGLHLLPTEDARELAIASLGLPPTVTHTEVQYELLRAVTWGLTRRRNPVHILRLLNRSVEIAAALCYLTADPESIRAKLREILDALSEAGDLIELDGGLWIPAPTRLVDVTRGDRALLVGGLPTRQLSPDARESIERNGPFRIVDRSAFLELSFPRESLSEWARKPSEPLDTWAKRILALDLPMYSSPGDGIAFHFYIPERAPAGAPQFKRWLDHCDGVTGTFLARRSRVFGAQEYRMVQVVDGHLVRSGAVLTPRDVRRLMYAFDAFAQNPTRAKWIVRSAGRILVLTSDLPQPEHRIFGAIGRLELDPSRVYERRWIFPAHYEQVLDLLHQLFIDVRDDRKAQR